MELTVSDSATGSESYQEGQYSNYSSAYYNYTGPYYDYYDGEGYYNYSGSGYDSSAAGYADYGAGYEEVQQQPDPLREIGYGGLVPGLNYSSVANQSGLYDEASVWSPKDYFFEVVINKCVIQIMPRGRVKSPPKCKYIVVTKLCNHATSR